MSLQSCYFLLLSWQSKAFLVANPLLAGKLERVVTERLSSGQTFQSEIGEIPSDPLPLATADSLRGPGLLIDTDEEDDVRRESIVARGLKSEGVLLEPGVASEADLLVGVGLSENDVEEVDDAMSRKGGLIG